jgi:uncharacterized membrane protein YeaQ/YmgE (transglycosylase-associated protein family)
MSGCTICPVKGITIGRFLQGINPSRAVPRPYRDGHCPCRLLLKDLFLSHWFSQKTPMDELIRLLIQVLIAVGCATAATILIPRQVPGKALGLALIGLIGVFVGQWIAEQLLSQYNLATPWLEWDFQGVAIVPSIIGSMIVLYLVTAFLSWGRYGNR